MKDVDLRGIIPAIVTPMTSEGELDLPALRQYVGWLVEQGPVALAVNVARYLRHDCRARLPGLEHGHRWAACTTKERGPCQAYLQVWSRQRHSCG